MTEPEYAIERTYATQELVNRLMLIIAHNLPALKPQLQSLWDDYIKVLVGIEDELARTNNQPQGGPPDPNPEQSPSRTDSGP